MAFEATTTAERLLEASVDGVLVFNTCYDSDRSRAAAAGLDVCVENTLEPLGPAHCSITLCLGAVFRVGDSLHAFAAFGRCNQPKKGSDPFF